MNTNPSTVKPPNPLQVRRGLGHLGRKLALGQSVTLAYFGGSITSAPGYRVMTTDWFRKTFPRSTITEVDAAVGGTDSTLGTYRLHADVLVHKPDLVIVEFAVNDGEKNILGAQRSMEGIVRRCLRAQPQPELCFVYTLADRHMEKWRAGKRPGMIVAHEEVAAHYRIPSIDVSMAMSSDLIAGAATWDQMFRDTCHPTDAGQAHYAATVKTGMRKLLARSLEAVSPRPIRDPLTDSPRENGQMIEVTPDTPRGDFAFRPMIKRGGWEPFAGVLESDKPGSEVAFDFEGTTIGLYFMLGKDSSDVEWSVDDSPFTHHSYFDEFALSFVRPVPVFFSDTLSPGKHRLRLRVSDQRDSRSIGNLVQFGALLYS